MPQRFRPVARAQTGIVLATALVFLLLLTLIGVTAMQGIAQQERMADNARQRTLALQGAEACLRWGETGWGSDGRGLLAATLPDFDGSQPGLLPSTDSARGSVANDAFWMDAYCWSGSESGCSGTGAASQACPALNELAAPARYAIEELPATVASASSAKFAALPQTRRYRITARSTGATPDAIVIAQTVYQR